MLTRIIGILIPVIVVFLYLIITGAMVDFINYAILGISTFSNRIPYMQLLQSDKIEIQILSIVVPVSIIITMLIIVICKLLKKDNINFKNILTLLFYSLSVIIVMYPISDEIHFLIGSIIAIIQLIYVVVLLIKFIYIKINWQKKYKVCKILLLIIWILIFATLLTKTMNNFYEYIISEKNVQINHYKYISINENLKSRINEIDTYILEKEEEGQKVYILDAEAAIYMIPIDRYNKDYDMFLKGNIGKDGEEGQIEKIKNRKENEIYLIRSKNLRSNWQTPSRVIEYIRENLENSGELSIYEIYR